VICLSFSIFDFKLVLYKSSCLIISGNFENLSLYKFLSIGSQFLSITLISFASKNNFFLPLAKSTIRSIEALFRGYFFENFASLLFM